MALGKDGFASQSIILVPTEISLQACKMNYHRSKQSRNIYDSLFIVISVGYIFQKRRESLEIHKKDQFRASHSYAH